MFVSLTRWVGLAGSGLAAAAFALPPAAILAEEEREIVIKAVVIGEHEKDDDKDDDRDDDKDEKNGKKKGAEAVKKPSYWLGVALEGPEGENGLTIAEVLPESPALKAGFKAGDVLVAIGDKKLRHAEQLIDLVQDSQGKAFKITYLRDGKELVREVVAGQRPTEIAVEVKEGKEEKQEENPNAKAPKAEKKEDPQPGIAWRKIEVAPKTGAGPPGSGTMHLYTVPKAGGEASGGSAYPPTTLNPQPMTARMAMPFPQSKLPDDMEVTISKKGNNPATVTARQGNKLWRTTENELDMLPPQAQAYAARALGKDVLRARTPGAAPGMGGAMMMPGMPGMPGMGGGMGMPGMSGMGVMPPMHAPPSATPARREVRAIELKLDKDGKVTGVQGGGAAPHVKVLPGGGIQVEIREGKEERKTEKKESKSDQPAAEKEDPKRAERIRDLQEQAERLRALLNKLRQEVKEKNEK